MANNSIVITLCRKLQENLHYSLCHICSVDVSFLCAYLLLGFVNDPFPVTCLCVSKSTKGRIKHQAISQWCVQSVELDLSLKSDICVSISFNPFDTKPMAKIAVKMSIMRVVKFMSSWDNDFMSWPKHHQLFFGGQSVELPLSLYWFPWFPPGGYQGLSLWEIWSKNSQSFDVWRTLTAIGVKGYRNRITCISHIMRPQDPLMPCTPQMLPSKYCQR